MLEHPGITSWKHFGLPSLLLADRIDGIMTFYRWTGLRIRISLSMSMLIAGCASYDRAHFDRNLFNTGELVSGTKPFPNYDPGLVGQLYDKRHEAELQMFDVINEAALRRDKRMKYYIDLYGDSLGYIPLLAVAHYKYAFGDKSQLDWLLAEDKKSGIGRDSLIITVFGYMDEWDKTVRWMKQNEEFNDKHEGGGASGEVVSQAIEIRKRIYGAERFKKAWQAIKIQ
jgi:hypothetical protein